LLSWFFCYDSSMNNYFLSNLTKTKFISVLENKILSSKKILFSVSFIKQAGFRLIKGSLITAIERGTHIQIITSSYKNFTDPSVLYELLDIQEKHPNIQIRLDHHSFIDKGFHTKGYLFIHDEGVTSIIGSTNLTRSALLTNFEWNAMYEGPQNDFFDSILEEFDSIWEHTKPISYELIKSYEVEKLNAFEHWDMDYELIHSEVKPNKMQQQALLELNRNRREKALIIAAMGTGKTYLAAMDAKAFGAKRILFVVHRENILDNAMKAFRDVFGPSPSMNKFLGDTKNKHADFIFTTNLTINQSYQQFDPYDFDYIIIDEVHHASASTYQQVIRYFKPDFLLGLTATPERMDNQNIFEIFDYKVPYEIRLRDAIENDIIVPFQYYGIRNKYINYDEKYTKKEVDAYLRDFTSEKNARFILEEIKKHPVNEKLKALCFCTSVDHAKAMAEAFNALGVESVSLTGEDNPQFRNDIYLKLSKNHDPLNIICTVDVLNEGIDIPAVNMVLFLRPTESVTIFIQQLGRGLRKHPNKPYLTVLDFIGNSYQRSIYIAKALGTLSNVPVFNKKQLIHLIKNDFQDIKIPDLKISLDQLSKEEILSYLENINEYSFSNLKQDYLSFKNYLGLSKAPKHTDYLDTDRSPDLVNFIRSSKPAKSGGRSYLGFLEALGETVPLFNHEQMKLIEFLSNLLPLIRPEEFFLIRMLLNGPKSKQSLKEGLKLYFIEQFIPFFEHALGYMTGRINPSKFNDKDAIVTIDSFRNYALRADLFNVEFKDFLSDLLEYGLNRYEKENGLVSQQLIPYKTYFNHQFMLAMCEGYLNYQKGTMIKDKKVYIFTNLNKEDQAKEDLKYHDAFINPTTFEWESKIDVTPQSKEGQKLIHSEEAHLFVRAKSNQGSYTLPMIYLGKGRLVEPNAHPSKSTTQFKLQLDQPVPEEIYEELKHAHE
jgi:superfamily II DNA or RNA helicase